MKISMLLPSLFALLFGVFMIVFGGWDDSPGAQFLGVLFCVAGIIGTFKSRKK